MSYPLLKNQMPLTIKKVWRKSWLLTTGIALIFGVIAGVVYYFVWPKQWLFYIILAYFGLVIIFSIIDFLLIPYRYIFHRYELNEKDLAFQEGAIFRSTTYVPLNRIQHIETEQGPFLRQENLVTLVIHTAATKHCILGLDAVTAQQLRMQILELIRQVKADE